MGGGDLNLKKSWHPQTLKNIERVWKAEQRHEAERKKIEELQKELREERAREEITRYAQETGAVKKKDERLDWMYQGPGGHVSREEYLLGRPIDKQITQQYEEPESGPSAQTGLLPGSIFSPTVQSSTFDLAAKIREDPLFVIRKQEEEKKRNVLKNPVKMKMIKEMLRQNLEEKKRKKKKEKKDKSKSKKEKSKKHRSRDECSVGRKLRHSSPSPAPSLPRSQSGYGLQLPDGYQSRVPLPPNTDRKSPLFHRSYQEPRVRQSSRSSEMHRSSMVEKRHPHKQQSRSYTKGLSSEELKRKRQEMMNCAQQRDEERASNVQKYKRQDEQEKRHDGKHGHHTGFIHDMKLESAASSSLEDRVKRNIHSLQRTPAALEKNFMRR
ncbi:pre-mRNA-splicing factor CWC25 homolog [Scleropages formosus]|uniref:CWC25 spliceosome associated protein homolog n=1 Tax=Scleropages formosus TaxID=113540 RepID=A0A8C9QYS7_SCLFO|nr:pre-mRNA-splicing factor CWC25 homolog [Scleropages formosus]